MSRASDKRRNAVLHLKSLTPGGRLARISQTTFTPSFPLVTPQRAYFISDLPPSTLPPARIKQLWWPTGSVALPSTAPHPSSQRVIDTADTVTEPEFEEVISAAMNNIDYSPEGELLCSTLQRVCNSYHTSTSPTNVFSIDLTQTASGSTYKVINYISKYFVPTTHKGYRFMVSKIDTFIGRYRRWLLLLGSDAGTGDLPPTADMSLVWTTHLLTPVAYHSWCREESGRLVNGYVEGERDLEEAEREMEIKWEKAHVLPVRREMLRHVYEEATTNPPVMSLSEKFGGEGPSGEGSGINEFSTSGGFGGFGGGD